MMYSQLAERLLNGETVRHTGHGNSMTPLIKSGQSVVLAPIVEPLQRGDMVFCKVNGYYYVHKVTAVGQDGRYQISNNHGHVNGWTAQVFGKVIEVL